MILFRIVFRSGRVVKNSFICEFTNISLRIRVFIFGRCGVIVSMDGTSFKCSFQSSIVQLVILYSIKSLPLFPKFLNVCRIIDTVNVVVSISVIVRPIGIR